MKVLHLSLLTLPVLTGCATYPLSVDDNLCREIAAFANSTTPGENHSVSLETAWGSSKNHPDSIFSRDCHHGGYAPGAQLCRFLMEHSATEFSENNFRRAFACLSNTPLKDRNYVSYEQLNVKVSAYGAYGVHDGVEVTIEFKPNTENATMQLDIGADALKPSP